MRQITEMPEVMECDAEQCAYNMESTCHARGITIGDRQQRRLCDTQWPDVQHTQRRELAGVGACRQTSCVNNEDFECQADGIRVCVSGGLAQCGTFSER